MRIERGLGREGPFSVLGFHKIDYRAQGPEDGPAGRLQRVYGFTPVQTPEQNAWSSARARSMTIRHELIPNSGSSSRA